ncbi:MAG: metallophosphoesterase family protein, partial [Kiritimatiellae bacterium]|nr:metallophosphoesterase family protein [Kiritimatiellia bacterium]
MSAFIISDLHLGSEFCQHIKLKEFLETIPDGVDLILNGDVVHSGKRFFQAEHLDVIDMLKNLSMDHRVVWISGNHDHICPVEDLGNIEFVPEYTIKNRLIIAHGHQFQNRIFLTSVGFFLLRTVYKIYIRFGARDMHAAYFAKKFPVLYSIFRHAITANACKDARKKGFSTIVCGHTHFAEEQQIKGVRYLNTGSWTEESF